MSMPDAYDLAEYCESFCLAQSVEGYVCSEWPHHGGDHRAEFEDDQGVMRVEQWPQETL